MTGKTLLSRTAAAGRWAALALSVALFGGFALAQEEAKSPEPLESELVAIRNSVKNASAKLKNDIVGIQSGDPQAPVTPARSCCSKNLARIEKRIATSHRILEDFDRCYTNAGQDEMVLASRVAKSDLISFSRALSAFAKAPNKGQAQGALHAMTRFYNLLRETAVSLTPCEGLESVTEPDEGSEQSEDSGQPKQSRED